MTHPAARTPGISADSLRSALEAFAAVGWEIAGPDNHEERAIFQRYCSMLGRLDEPQRQLILRLTREFLRCTFSNYEAALRIALDAISAELSAASEIFIIPLTSPRHFGLSKSGGMMIYLCKAALARRGLAAEGFEQPALLRGQVSRKNALVLLVDDYVGTGETAAEAILNYLTNLRVASDTAIAVTLVAQQRAVEEIAIHGIRTVTGHLRKRGISDSPSILDKAAALAVMDSVEDMLGIDVTSDYRRGYLGSEALVCMLRCPDNTFPTFWHSEKVGDVQWPAPFRR